MITELEIQNYKCFDHLRLDFGKLTLLTGFNGAGKSTSTQPLFLLSQAFENNPSPTSLTLNGSHVDLGTVGDVLPAQSQTSEMMFRVKGVLEQATFHLKGKASERRLLVTKLELLNIGKINPVVETLGMTLDESLSTINYLSAIREGTPDNYPIPTIERDLWASVGKNGCYAPYWHEKLADTEITANRCHPSETSNILRRQFNAWLGTLFPGAEANVQLFPQLSLLNLQFRLSDISDWRRPANLGYGFSYAFPILIALLIAKPGQVLIIDSPESHLHPYAQSQMGKILATFANSGVQIIVETHSDHLLNGIRVAVKDSIMKHEDLKIYFFQGVTTESHGVHSLAVDKEGRISDWPGGFFDQSEADLAHLAGW